VEAEKIMKKLMTALAVCAVAGFALAQSVTSANVVGYNNVTLNPGFNMLAVNLDNVSAPAAGLTLNTLIPGTTAGLTKGTLPASADTVMVYNPNTTGYNTYYLYYTTKGTSTTNNNLWVIDATHPATNTFKSGSAFWYNKFSTPAVTIPFAGQVPQDASKTHTIVHGFNMIGSGYAAGWDPNGLGTAYWHTNGAFSATLPATADNIMVYNSISSNYTTYYLYYTTKGTSTTNNYLWVTDATHKAPTNFISLGTAVWYNHMGTGFVLPQTAPYNLQ